MSLPMFPPGECFPTTSPHVFVHKPPYDGTNFRVWFRVDVQHFMIGEADDLDSAMWSATMFIKALRKYRAEPEHHQKE